MARRPEYQIRFAQEALVFIQPFWRRWCDWTDAHTISAQNVLRAKDDRRLRQAAMKGWIVHSKAPTRSPPAVARHRRAGVKVPKLWDTGRAPRGFNDDAAPGANETPSHPWRRSHVHNEEKSLTSGAQTRQGHKSSKHDLMSRSKGIARAPRSHNCTPRSPYGAETSQARSSPRPVSAREVGGRERRLARPLKDKQDTRCGEEESA